MAETAAGWQKNIGDYLAYVALRLLICLLQALPVRLAESLADALAWLFGDVLRVRDRVVDDNLRHAFPEMTAQQRKLIRRGMWRHFVLMLFEISQAPRKIHESNWHQHISLTNRRKLSRLLLSGKPFVVVTGHFGNFEMGGFISGLLGFPAYSVARPIDNPYIHRFLQRFRGATGQHILPTQGSAALAQSVVESGEILALLGDHYGGPKGCWIEYFGRPASCHKSIALFALLNELPLLVIHTTREKRPLQFVLDVCALSDPDDRENRGSVKELTQWYSRHLERHIRRKPDQYWWLHRRWKDTRPSKKRSDVPSPHFDVRASADSSSGHRRPAQSS